MKTKLPALKDVVERHSSPTNVMVMLAAALVLTPYVVDRIMRQPLIDVQLTYVKPDPETGRTGIIRSKHDVSMAVRGQRHNIVYDNENNIICSKPYTWYWDKDAEATWSLSAFADCESVPLVPFKICSIFSLQSKSGIERKFGQDYEFCTEYFNVGNS